jgi:Domain of unknown function (DUF4395)
MSSPVLSFPDPVNEKAARVVAAGVVLLAALTLATSMNWLLLPLAYGFLARTLAGPALSPLGRFATQVAAPRLGTPRHVPGPPKRFAQAIGALLSTSAAVLALGFGAHVAADVLLAMLLVAAFLEAAFALCLGCRLFALGMRVGLVPERVCLECADLTRRSAA